MLIRLVEGERPPDKRDLAVIEESFANVGGSTWAGWYFAAAGQVHPAQKERAAGFIYEVMAINLDRHWICLRWTREPVCATLPECVFVSISPVSRVILKNRTWKLL
jgi:hypothetical protein